MQFAPRQDTACPSSQLLYTCSSNGFYGCCSVNPCGPGGCPGIPIQKQLTPVEKASSNSQSTQALNTEKSSPTSQTRSQSTTEGQTTAKPQISSNTELSGTTLLPAIVLITSTIIERQKSNDGALMTSTSIFSSTSLSETSAVVISTTSPLPIIDAGSSPGSNSKAIIGGVIGGVGGVAVVLTCILLCFLWRKKQNGRRNGPIIDGNTRTQGIDANRAGDAIENYDALDDGGKKTHRFKCKEPSKISKTGRKGNCKRRWPFSNFSSIMAKSNEDLVPYLDSRPIRTDLEMAGSSTDPAGLKPELSGSPAANLIAELSPHPERSYINSPKRPSASTWSSNDANTEGNLPHNADQSLMRPNLRISPTALDHHNPQKSDGNRHVMSWMNYEEVGGYTKTKKSTTNQNDIENR